MATADNIGSLRAALARSRLLCGECLFFYATARGDIDHAFRPLVQIAGVWGSGSIEFPPSRNEFSDELFGVHLRLAFCRKAEHR